MKKYMKVLALLMVSFIILIGIYTMAVASSSKELKGEIRFTPLVLMPNIPGGEGLEPLTALADIAEEYEKLHPGVKVTFVEFPEEQGLIQWYTAQLTAGTAPEIIAVIFDLINRDAVAKNWFVNLDPYLEKPNPYVEGNKRWGDQFKIIWKSPFVGADGHMYCLDCFTASTFLLSNKDILEKLGIKGRPEDWIWAEWESYLKKIKTAGYIPIAWAPKAKFFDGMIEDAIMDPVIRKMDLDKNDAISHYEIVKAVKEGLWSAKDPRFQEVQRLYKELSQYFQDGWLMADWGTMIRLFVTGKAAFSGGVSRQYVKIKDDPYREFEMGTSRFLPQITKETTKYYSGVKMPYVGQPDCGPGGITYVAKKRGKVDLCVDWMRFLSKPENVRKVISEAKFTGPNIKGVNLPSELEILSLPEERNRIHDIRLTHRYSLESAKIREEYLTDQITLDEAMDKLQKLMEEEADALIKQYGWEGKF